MGLGSLIHIVLPCHEEATDRIQDSRWTSIYLSQTLQSYVCSSWILSCEKYQVMKHILFFSVLIYKGRVLVNSSLCHCQDICIRFQSPVDTRTRPRFGCHWLGSVRFQSNINHALSVAPDFPGPSIYPGSSGRSYKCYDWRLLWWFWNWLPNFILSWGSLALWTKLSELYYLSWC